MMGLDSLYAMLARPVQTVSQPKRVVEQVKSSHELAADSHESPQSQLPPKLERRPNPQEDRRRGTSLDRRANRRQTDHIEMTEQEEQLAREQAAAAKGHIDIEV